MTIEHRTSSIQRDEYARGDTLPEMLTCEGFEGRECGEVWSRDLILDGDGEGNGGNWTAQQWQCPCCGAWNDWKPGEL